MLAPGARLTSQLTVVPDNCAGVPLQVAVSTPDTVSVTVPVTLTVDDVTVPDPVVQVKAGGMVST